jgi:two-component system, OmpR family, sensor histidine kinase KdpD
MLDSPEGWPQSCRMADTGSLLPDTRGWAAAPTLPRALGAISFLALAALTTHLTQDSLPEPSGLFVFFVAVLLASVRYGFWIGVASAIAAFATFNFLFVHPRYTFAIASPGDLLVLAEFLGVAGLTGFLAGRLREEANAAMTRAEVLEALSAFASDLAKVDGLDAIRATMSRHVSALALGPVVVLQPLAEGFAPDSGLDAEDLQAAERALRRQRREDPPRAGQEGGRFAFLPLIQAGEVVLILGHPPLGPDRADHAVREQAIEVICRQANLAIERLHLAKTAEDARTSATREALRAALLTSLSHDLRTPLATILGAITSLRELGDTLPPEARDDLALAIEEEARRLSHYVDNLLQMTRLQTGMEPHLVWVDPADVIRSVLSRIAIAFPSSKIEVDLPELPMLRAEAALLEQALFNLLDNAVKFSPKASAIRVTATVAAESVALSVTDQGPGIPQEALTEVFKPFYRADPQRPGTGLGLSISSGIVQALGGKLTVTSPVRDGHGTCMCILLPVPRSEL